MIITLKELWTIIHGMGFGAIFLLAFAGGFAGLWSLRPEYITDRGMKERMGRLLIGTWTMAIVVWLTVIVGTYIVYPWYRAKPPEGANIVDYPRSYLLADPKNLAGWHTFGMEWKEHIAWIAPFLATAVAYVVTYYRSQLAHEEKIRKYLIFVFSLAFATAGIAGLFGAFITKAAPIR